MDTAATAKEEADYTEEVAAGRRLRLFKMTRGHGRGGKWRRV